MGLWIQKAAQLLSGIFSLAGWGWVGCSGDRAAFPGALSLFSSHPTQTGMDQVPQESLWPSPQESFKPPIFIPHRPRTSSKTNLDDSFITDRGIFSTSRDLS